MTFFTQGVEKSRSGGYEAAIQDFDQALQIDPFDPEVYGHRCVARYQLGDKLGAIADCQQAASLYLNPGKTKEHQYSLKMLSKLQK
jgi:Flp pilus assembly protein TadD